MPKEKTSSRPKTSAKKKTGGGCPEATCSAWIPLAERYPKVGKRVLVCCEYTNRRPITIAKWQPAGTIDGQFWDEYPEEWEDEETETITNPDDLWVEYAIEIEQSAFLDNVTHWMPLPSLPNASHQP